MSTDRELLELAAKAAGISLEYRRGSDAYYYDDIVTGREQWDPLANDGQALRLAVKLRINLEHMATMGGADFGINTWPRGRGDCGVSEDGDLSDYEAATRRAIVRAAAEVGRQLP